MYFFTDWLFFVKVGLSVLAEIIYYLFIYLFIYFIYLFSIYYYLFIRDSLTSLTPDSL